MNVTKPTRHPNVITKQIDNETVLYTSDQETVYVLNPTARLIWEFCDGEHTLQDMEEALRIHFSIDSGHDLMADIEQTLESFAARGLLQPDS